MCWKGRSLYGELRTALFDYAETKKDLQSRRSALEELYKDVKGADIDAEPDR